MTEQKIFEMIVNVCAWMNGSIQYDKAKIMSISELVRINNLASKINKSINKG